jgi:hypothetical protein
MGCLKKGDVMFPADPIPSLLPYVALLALIVLLPSLEAASRGRFDLFHPLTYAAWSYWLPGFVAGGLLIAFGMAPRAFYWALLPEPERDLAATVLYLTLGFAALTAGFACVWERLLPAGVTARVERWQWSLDEVFVPAASLVIVGAAVNVFAVAVGAFGYQTGDAALVGPLYFAAMPESFGVLILWIAIFRAPPGLTRLKVLSVALIVGAALLRGVLAGGRGPLVFQVTLIAGAYFAAGKPVRVRTLGAMALFGVAAVFAGFVYGSTYRLVKGSQAPATLAETAGYVGRTFEVVAERSLVENVDYALTQIIERVEVVSQVAVVVANHEQLQVFEEGAGLSDSIWSATVGAFVPRFLWPDKPPQTDPRAFAALYYGYRDNSFAISLIGDLVRNGGALAVVLGMFAIGTFLRVIHAVLWTPVSVGGRAGYLLLLVTLGYEGSFGPVLPTAVRTAVVIALGLIVILAYRRLTSPARLAPAS